jgi:homoserine kinase type II
MTQKTSYTFSELNLILKMYPELSQKKISGAQIPEGTVNTLFKIKSSKKLYFLKVDELKDKNRLKTELLYFQWLKKNQKQLGFLTPEILVTSQNQQTALYKGKQHILMKSLPGKSKFKSLDLQEYRQLGKALRKLHDLPVDLKIPEHRFKLSVLKRLFHSQNKHWLDSDPSTFQLCQKIFGLLQKHSVKNLSHFIHADLFPDNVLWEKGRLVGILDFEASGLGDPLFDLMTVIWAFCRRKQGFQNVFSHEILKGYFGSLNKAREKSPLLHLAFLNSGLRFCLTRFQDFELPKIGSKSRSVYRDYREFSRLLDKGHSLENFLQLLSL